MILHDSSCELKRSQGSRSRTKRGVDKRPAKRATSIAPSELICISTVAAARLSHMPQHELVTRMISHVSDTQTRSHTFKLGCNQRLQLFGTTEADRTKRVDVRVTARRSSAAESYLCRGVGLAEFRYRSRPRRRTCSLLSSSTSTLMRCVHKLMLLAPPLNTLCLSESRTEKNPVPVFQRSVRLSGDLCRTSKRPGRLGPLGWRLRITACGRASPAFRSGRAPSGLPRR